MRFHADLLALCLIPAGFVGLSILNPAAVPAFTLCGLVLSVPSFLRHWKSLRGTALRPSLCWFALAGLLAAVSQVQAILEPIETGRPLTGHWVYLCALATLAALLSVFNARRPGSGAWAFLMGVLVLLFLIPWVEAQGSISSARAAARLRLEAPWNAFFAILVVAATANFAATRRWPIATLLFLALGLVLFPLTFPETNPRLRAHVWTALPFTLAALGLRGLVPPRQQPQATLAADRLWLWFRDHWGAAWALRVRERFNRESAVSDWGIQLGWRGLLYPRVTSLRSGNITPMVPQAKLALAYTTLRALLKRFADAERMDEVASYDESASVDPGRSAPTMETEAVEQRPPDP